MLQSLSQSLLQFMELFALGVGIACLCYAFSYAANIDTPGCAGLLGSAFLLLTGMVLSLPVLAAALFCIPGAMARKAVKGTRTSALVHYFDLLTTTFLGIAIGTLVAYFASSPFWGICGLFLGLATTPSAFPIFRWIWRNSKMRPGFDRHLNSFDEINPPQ